MDVIQRGVQRADHPGDAPWDYRRDGAAMRLMFRNMEITVERSGDYAYIQGHMQAQLTSARLGYEGCVWITRQLQKSE